MNSQGGRTPAGEVIAGNVYDKYGTKKPVERWLVGRFMSCVVSLAVSTRPVTILEVGCGEGRVSDRLKAAMPECRVFGCDLSHGVVALAARDYPSVAFFSASAYDIPAAAGSIDLVVACEVLEHLDEPERALKEMDRISSGHILVSVPREPLWRVMNMVRGKYIQEFGNTPGHVRHWSKGGIVRLLGKYFDVTHTASPAPWTVCLCSKRRA